MQLFRAYWEMSLGTASASPRGCNFLELAESVALFPCVLFSTVFVTRFWPALFVFGFVSLSTKTVSWKLFWLGLPPPAPKCTKTVSFVSLSALFVSFAYFCCRFAVLMPVAAYLFLVLLFSVCLSSVCLLTIIILIIVIVAIIIVVIIIIIIVVVVNIVIIIIV